MANDPFDDMPKFTLEKDDLESFQRTRGQASKNTSKKEAVSFRDSLFLIPTWVSRYATST